MLIFLRFLLVSFVGGTAYHLLADGKYSFMAVLVGLAIFVVLSHGQDCVERIIESNQNRNNREEEQS